MQFYAIYMCVSDTEEANGQNMSGKWIYSYKANADWCSFAKVVLHQIRKVSANTNTRSVTVNFFIKAGKIYIFQSTKTWLTLFCPRVKLNALQKSTSSIIQHIFDHFPLYHKTKTRHSLIVETFHALMKIKQFIPPNYIYIYIYKTLPLARLIFIQTMNTYLRVLVWAGSIETTYLEKEIK